MSERERDRERKGRERETERQRDRERERERESRAEQPDLRGVVGYSSGGGGRGRERPLCDLQT